MGIGTAAAQTYGAPAQDTTPNSPSTFPHVMSQGKTAKGKTSKHRTVGMWKGSKTKSDMKQDGTAKPVLSHSYLRRWSHAAARGFNPDALASRVSIFAVADSRGWAGHTQ